MEAPLGGLTLAEDASNGSITRPIFQTLQEDRACIQAHTLFSNIQQADAVLTDAKDK